MLTNFQIVPRTIHFLITTNVSNHFAGCTNFMDLPDKHPLMGGSVRTLGRPLDDVKTAKVPTLVKVAEIMSDFMTTCHLATTLLRGDSAH